jgi:hypothetical protein
MPVPRRTVVERVVERGVDCVVDRVVECAIVALPSP